MGSIVAALILGALVMMLLFVEVSELVLSYS